MKKLNIPKEADYNTQNYKPVHPEKMICHLCHKPLSMKNSNYVISNPVRPGFFVTSVTCQNAECIRTSKNIELRRKKNVGEAISGIIAVLAFLSTGVLMSIDKDKKSTEEQKDEIAENSNGQGDKNDNESDSK